MKTPAHPEQRDDASLGVYLHIPFCERICPYCDFAVVAARPLQRADEQRYVDALLRELELRQAEWPKFELATLYFGGGTPSLLQPESVARLVGAVGDVFAPRSDLEVTLEVNPSTSPRESLPGMRAAGVNRLSIGVQSFDDDKLRRLGRAHRAPESRLTLSAARATGFDNVSIDLIFRAPSESIAQFERDLECFAEAGVEHVSVYELTIEAATPFGAAERSGRLPARESDDAAADMIERIESRFSAAGLQRYELSSYARPGFESRHNRRYWERRPVLGLGLGAWSSIAASATAPHGGRRSNFRGLGAYLAAIEAGAIPDEGVEVHDAATARGEAVFLGLRRTLGVDAVRFEREFGAPPRAYFEAAIDSLCRAGLTLESERGDLQLTRRGRLLADSVAARFV